MTDQESSLLNLDMLFFRWIYFLYLKLTLDTTIYSLIGFAIFSMGNIFFLVKKPKLLRYKFETIIAKNNNRLLGWTEKKTITTPC
ncbi:hypothetical protein NEF87_000129 [Candidatus Lokiarchaeum ossiferum]|uniref:Uncharacterized protein n=1 Tax=Candidatus Lokiarchaeum ossiferum TaxID=2951803 RepID=A0ABY6HMX7_9ARCH|nr:hypothetical protein NEF87_000129 [Candidatus Lokiarchaeum sp. B-35]